MISFPKYFSEWTYFFSFLDIDECAEGLHSCDVHAYCNNTAGSYTHTMVTEKIAYCVSTIDKL